MLTATQQGCTNKGLNPLVSSLISLHVGWPLAGLSPFRLKLTKEARKVLTLGMIGLLHAQEQWGPGLDRPFDCACITP